MSLHAAAVSAAQASRVSWAAIKAERWLLRLFTRQSAQSSAPTKTKLVSLHAATVLAQLQDVTHGEDHGAFLSFHLLTLRLLTWK